DFLTADSALADLPDAGRVAPFERSIELRRVSFKYGDRRAIDDLSFNIERGAFVGIVGRSGSGKSTLLNLLLRLSDPWTGVIFVDGVDLRTCQQRWWRAQIGIVFQDNFLFNTSIRENIRLGRPAATDTDVEAAAEAAGVHSFIANLPRGYDTEVGERGGRLS